MEAHSLRDCFIMNTGCCSTQFGRILWNQLSVKC